MRAIPDFAALKTTSPCEEVLATAIALVIELAGVEEVQTAQLADDDAIINTQKAQLAADVAQIASDATLIAALMAEQAAIARLAASIQTEAAEIASLTLPFNQPGPASKLTLTIKSSTGDTMPVSLSIDDTTGDASWAWDDDKGDTDAAAPLDASGAPVVVTAGSDNTAVAAVGASDQTAKTAPITPAAEGTFNVTLTVTDSTGAPAVWPTGTPGGLDGTPITAEPLAAQVVAGAAGSLVASAVA